MKNLRITTLLMATIALLSFSSCSDDDSDDGNNDGAKSPSNAFTFDGNSYSMKSGLIIDYGPADVAPSGLETHYNYDFYIYDSGIGFVQDTINGDYYSPDANTTIAVYVELYSPDTNSFNSGTFNFIDEDSVDTGAADVTNEYFFSNGEVELDNDGVVNGDLDGPEYEIIGGTIVVTGSSFSNYSISFNIQTNGGKTLTGTYSGSFEYQEDDDL